jgi:hypothetical protein
VNYPYSIFLGLDGSMDVEGEGSMADGPEKVNPCGIYPLSSLSYRIISTRRWPVFGNPLWGGLAPMIYPLATLL